MPPFRGKTMSATVTVVGLPVPQTHCRHLDRLLQDFFGRSIRLDGVPHLVHFFAQNGEELVPASRLRSVLAIGMRHLLTQALIEFSPCRVREIRDRKRSIVDT